MAVQTINGTTTLTPTAWKWWMLAVMGLFVMPLGVVLLLFGGVMASGKGQRIVMTRDAVTVKNWWQTKSYRWTDIEDFRIKKIRTGLFITATMISVTQREKADTAMGKFTKFVSGGTDDIPVVGVSATEMLGLMYGYQAGHVPEAVVTHQRVPALRERQVPEPMQTRQPVQKRPVVTRNQAPSTPVRPAPQPVLRKKSPVAAKPKPKARNTKQAPMVQEGFRLFGRRPS